MPENTNTRLTACIAGSYPELCKILQQNPDIKLSEIILAPGDHLFKQGDSADAVFFISQGILRAQVSQKDAAEIVAARLEPGDLIGELGLLVQGKRLASIVAEKNAVVIRLAKADFENLVARFPVVKKKIVDIVKSRLLRRRLLEVLPDFFGPLQENMIKEIEANLTWISLPGNQYLFHEGEEDNSLYFVVSGRLRAIKVSKNGAIKVLAEIVRGESIGEIGLITGKARTASVQAVRDCELVKLSRQGFEHIGLKYPQMMLALSKIVVQRLHTGAEAQKNSRNCINIGVLATGQLNVPPEFFSHLTAALVKLGPTLSLSEHILYDRLGTSIDNAVLEAWLEEQESKYRFILFEIGNQSSNWAKWCLRQSDHILRVANGPGEPAPSALEKALDSSAAAGNAARHTLVIQHPENTTLPHGTCAWLSSRNVAAHYHVRYKNNADYMRLGRILAGKAVGLVLGGGGARGFAHIGVIKALEEAGIPIDLIGGTSMGSMIAAQYAMGWDYATMLEQNQDLFIQKKPLRDYTLPIISVLSGRKFDRMAKAVCGDTCIEDLWIKYFCIDCNLATCDVRISRSGLVWQAIRASSSLPGILAPVMEDKQPHIDGGILNNLPGDIMRQTDAGKVIVVDVNPSDEMTYHWDKMPSHWKVLMSRILPFKKPIAVPDIMTVMMRTTIINSIYNTAKVKKNSDLFLQPPVEDFGLLEFKAFERIVAAGHTYTRNKLLQPETQHFLK